MKYTNGKREERLRYYLAHKITEVISCVQFSSLASKISVADPNIKKDTIAKLEKLRKKSNTGTYLISLNLVILRFLC